MAELQFETDQLLAELGITSGGGEGAPAAAAKPPPVPPLPPAGGGAPPPPPPPPPAAPAAKASSGGASIKLKTSGGNLKSAHAAQKEIDDIFDSVISFAGKTSSKKKVPPPVAPKPKRKIHVSSYAMQVKKPEPKDSGTPSKPEPPKLVAVAQAPPPPPPPAPVTATPQAPTPSVTVLTPSDKPPEPEAIPEPIPMVAFGPGLETLEVNCYGDFQVSCTHDTTSDDLEVSVKGPTGSKPVEITEHGNGQFSCSYLPTAAGDHTISINVEDKPIPGSPFTAHVKFAAYTDKCSAEGPGLLSGSTTEPCHFKIKSKDEAGYARMRIHIVGPSKAEPIEMEEDMEEKCVNVTYHHQLLEITPSGSCGEKRTSTAVLSQFLSPGTHLMTHPR